MNVMRGLLNRPWRFLKGELPMTLFFCLFLVVWTFLLPSRLHVSNATFYLDDARSYHVAAIHLADAGVYSLNGRTPYVEREPGYSAFLAVLYHLFGNGNRLAVFIGHLLAFAVSAVCFLSAFRRVAPPLASLLAVFLLFFSPAVFHLLFFGYREVFALSLLLALLAACLASARHSSVLTSLMTGALAGVFALTYMPMFLVPPALLILLVVVYRVPLTHAGIALSVFLSMLGSWGARNYHVTDGACILGGCERSELAWAVRAEQLSTFTFADPFRCLVAEYVTRNFDAVPLACRFGPTVAAVEIDGAFTRFRERAFLHPVLYAWTSAMWAVEYHFPYVNGWGRTYNVLELLWSAMLYAGIACLLVFRTWKKEYWLFVLPILLTTALFALIDVEPRYRMPIYGCYAALAAAGYGAVFSRLLRRFR